MNLAASLSRQLRGRDLVMADWHKGQCFKAVLFFGAVDAVNIAAGNFNWSAGKP
ncbi:MAG TPA: hypothetical protein VNQ79_24465 [Blastocatellia bacterium]|nr:hypothetical protein [Blastocatellia bacterium]